MAGWSSMWMQWMRISSSLIPRHLVIWQPFTTAMSRSSYVYNYWSKTFAQWQGNSNMGSVWKAIKDVWQVCLIKNHTTIAGLADKARRLLPVRLGPARLLDRLPLVETKLQVDDQADRVDEQRPVKDRCQWAGRRRRGGGAGRAEEDGGSCATPRCRHRDGEASRGWRLQQEDEPGFAGGGWSSEHLRLLCSSISKQVQGKFRKIQVVQERETLLSWRKKHIPKTKPHPTTQIDRSFPQTAFCPLLNISQCPPTDEAEFPLPVSLYSPLARPVDHYVR